MVAVVLLMESENGNSECDDVEYIQTMAMVMAHTTISSTVTERAMYNVGNIMEEAKKKEKSCRMRERMRCENSPNNRRATEKKK